MPGDEGAGESVLTAPVDLQRLRARRMVGRMNYPAQSKSELFGREFSKQILMASDQGPGTRQTGQDTIERLQSDGIIASP